MTFEHYIENLQKFAEENPHTLNYQVVYAEDDEGNGFQSLCRTPTEGLMIDDEWISKDNYEDEYDAYKGNAVCIN